MENTTQTTTTNAANENVTPEQQQAEIRYAAALKGIQEAQLPQNYHTLAYLAGAHLVLRDHSSNAVLGVSRQTVVAGQKPTFVVVETVKTEKQGTWIYASGVYRSLQVDITVEDFQKDLSIKTLAGRLKTGNARQTGMYSFQIGLADGKIPSSLPKGVLYISWDAADHAAIPADIHFGCWRVLADLFRQKGLTLSKSRGFFRGKTQGTIVDIDHVATSPEVGASAQTMTYSAGDHEGDLAGEVAGN